MNNIMILLTQAVPEGRVFGLDQQTLISIGIQLLNGIILAAALGFILYKPVKEFMHQRSERIRRGIEDAEAARAEAAERMAAYEAKIQDIDQERLEILEAARGQASEEARAILEAARQEAALIKARSLESAEQDKKRLHEEVRLHVVDLSALLASRYLSGKMDQASHDQYFEQALAQLEEVQWPG